MDPFFEDLHVGYSATSEPTVVSKQDIIDFATKWDPQPFHIDEEAATKTFFGQLVASGVHSFAVTMRLGVDCRVLTGNSVAGLGVDKMRFPAPLLPDTTVTATFTVESLRRSESKPGFGVVNWSVAASDHRGTAIFTAIFTNLYRCRGT